MSGKRFKLARKVAKKEARTPDEIRKLAKFLGVSEKPKDLKERL